MQVDSYALMGSWLDSFVGEVFSPLARSNRRATAGLYVRDVRGKCSMGGASRCSRSRRGWGWITSGCYSSS